METGASVISILFYADSQCLSITAVDFPQLLVKRLAGGAPVYIALSSVPPKRVALFAENDPGFRFESLSTMADIFQPKLPGDVPAVMRKPVTPCSRRRHLLCTVKQT
jgi:hypothetical protein